MVLTQCWAVLGCRAMLCQSPGELQLPGPPVQGSVDPLAHLTVWLGLLCKEAMRFVKLYFWFFMALAIPVTLCNRQAAVL